MFEESTISWDTLKSYVANMPPKQYDHISPSSLGGCHRAHFYKIKGIKATTPPNIGALVNFQVGHQVERTLAKAYESEGTLVKWFEDGTCEPFTDPVTGLGGLPDILATSNGKTVLIDCKTVASKWFSYVSKYKSLKDWVADNKSYVYQQVAYLYLLRKNGYPDLDTAVLSFFSKDNGYIGKEFAIIWTPELEQMMLDRVMELKGYLDRNELPPCTCAGWQVGYCDFGDPTTQVVNKTKKVVNSTCCSAELWEKFNRGKE